MAKFFVQVERTYTARHVAFVEIEADDLDAAIEAVEAGLPEGEIDPTEGHYDNTHDSEGYDSVDSWSVADDGEHRERAADEPFWAGGDGRCVRCQGHHYITPPCFTPEN